MNSSDLSNTASPLVSIRSKLKRKAKNPTTTTYKKQRFSFYHLQNFLLPDSIIYYITMKPSSATAYQKLIQTCKYFFTKNPILVDCSVIYHKRWYDIDLNTIAPKVWITDRLSVMASESWKKFYKYKKSMIDLPELELKRQSVLSSAIPKFYRCGVKYVYFCNQVFSYKDFGFLSSKIEDFNAYYTVVKNEDGTVTAFENLVKAMPKIKRITFEPNKFLSLGTSKAYFEENSMIRSSTMKELIKLPNFSKLKHLRLDCLPETFDIESFSVYMKVILLYFDILFYHDSITEAYNDRIEAVIDEIINNCFNKENCDYIVPDMYLPRLNGEKSMKYRFIREGIVKF